MNRIALLIALAALAAVPAVAAGQSDEPAPRENGDGEVVMCGGEVATIVGTEGDDEIEGTDGVDVIQGLGGDDSIVGNGGNDVICGGDGDDYVCGEREGTGEDQAGLFSTCGGDQPEPDRIFGGSGGDFVETGGGGGTVRGGPGDDHLCDGEIQRETECVEVGARLYGGGGDDRLVGTRAWGGSGDDWLSAGALNYGYVDDEDVEDDLSFRGGRGRDLLVGARGADDLRGGPGPDKIEGGDGPDDLRGGKGSDVLRGEGGPDVLRGGPGQDRCYGGPGRNVRRGCEAGPKTPGRD